MSGHVGDLSEQQLAALDSLRNRVDDILRPNHNDYFLLKWLRARNFDVDATEGMLRASLKWREQFGVDQLLDEFEPPEVLRKYYPQGLFGHDCEGCPVWIIPCGNSDLKGMLYSAKKSDILKYIILGLERAEQDMKEQTEKLGKQIETHTCIFDMENFSMKMVAWKPALDLLINILKIYEANYPETLKKAFVINAPKAYPLFYAMIKPFLGEETKKKIHIYSKGTWKGAILEDIDPNELPQHWGGTLIDEIDGNPFCSSKICMGGPVPCSYYMAPSRRLSSDQDLQTTTIEKKGVFTVDLNIEQAGSTITWTFQTENYDIGFGVTFMPDSKDGETPDSSVVKLMPIERVNCQLVPEDGTLLCPKTGIYTLVFDNSFSWCRSKKLMYEVQVTPPESKSKPEEATNNLL